MFGKMRKRWEERKSVCGSERVCFIRKGWWGGEKESVKERESARARRSKQGIEGNRERARDRERARERER